jgi:hypothetical protein
VFEKLLQVLRLGCSYKRIGDSPCQARNQSQNSQFRIP